METYKEFYRKTDPETKKKIKLAENILMAIALPGAIAFGPLAGGLAMFLGGVFIQKKYSKSNIRRALRKLEKDGLVKTNNKQGTEVYKLTLSGKQKVFLYKLKNLKLKRQKKWDKKWRLIVFDIPEKNKTARDILVRKLKELGVIQLQKSVWVFPFECKEEIGLVKEAYGVRPYIRYIVADSVDGEGELKKEFGLK